MGVGGGAPGRMVPHQDTQTTYRWRGVARGVEDGSESYLRFTLKGYPDEPYDVRIPANHMYLAHARVLQEREGNLLLHAVAPVQKSMYTLVMDFK
jgi:hypothetical protein